MFYSFNKKDIQGVKLLKIKPLREKTILVFWNTLKLQYFYKSIMKKIDFKVSAYLSTDQKVVAYMT